MPDSRRARRLSDPGLQPERTSLAWFRTLLGYGALLALALRHNWHQASPWFWMVLSVIGLVGLVIYGYARRRNVMDVALSDYVSPGALRARLLIALGVLALALIFASAHVRWIVAFLKEG